jgi:hypothetical protein
MAISIVMTLMMVGRTLTKMIEHETFFSLLQDLAHWEFELTLQVIFDGFIGLLLWPWFRKKVLHHRSDDIKILALEKEMREIRTILNK